MFGQEIVQRVPAHVRRQLTFSEEVRYLTRPRLLPLYMLVFIAAVVLGMAVFSAVIEDPGFLRLLSIPALPVLGGVIGYFIQSPVIAVTNSRIISAGRFLKPRCLDLEKLQALRVEQNLLGRLIGYGTLVLLFHPREDRGEGVFLQFELKKLPDGPSLSSAILAAAGALRN